jgi:hypothetical protein
LLTTARKQTNKLKAFLSEDVGQTRRRGLMLDNRDSVYCPDGAHCPDGFQGPNGITQE